VIETIWSMIETVPLGRAADGCIDLFSTGGNHQAVREVTDELTNKIRIIRPRRDGDASSIHSAECQSADNR
jgi:hypothetical protein